MTDPSTPAPSDEAVKAALRVAQVRRLPGSQAAVDQIVSAALTAAAPIIAAEAAAEARADYDDFIEGLTAKLNAAGVPAMPSWPDAIDWLIERAQSAQAEARAATLAAVEAWLEAREVGTARIADFHRTLNPEAKVKQQRAVLPSASTHALVGRVAPKKERTTVTFTDSEVSEIAVTALGRISVEMFQPGGGVADVSFDTPGFDYLVTRAGVPIGYGELAKRYAEAIDAEIAERRAAT